jgi:UDP-glucose 4-epimerase
MKILITGGAGFIGSHLADKLIQKKHKVVVVDNLSSGKKRHINKKAKFYKLVIQSKKISDIFKKERPDIVYHLAAQMNVRASIDDPIFDANTNILGSLNLLENSVKSKVKKFVFISTGGAIYGDGVKLPTPESALEAPISPYGVAKLTIEKYLHYYNNQYNLPYTVLRLANIYGPRQDSKGEAGVVAIFSNQLLNNKPLTVFGGAQTRDFVYVLDVVDAATKAMSRNIKGIYNIGTSRQTSVDKLAKMMISISESSSKIIHKKYIVGEQLKSCLSASKAKRQLKWSLKYDLNKGLTETINWFNNN